MQCLYHEKPNQYPASLSSSRKSNRGFPFQLLCFLLLSTSCPQKRKVEVKLRVQNVSTAKEGREGVVVVEIDRG